MVRLNWSEFYCTWWCPGADADADANNVDVESDNSKGRDQWERTGLTVIHSRVTFLRPSPLPTIKCSKSSGLCDRGLEQSAGEINLFRCAVPLNAGARQITRTPDPGNNGKYQEIQGVIGDDTVSTEY